jgi:metal-dependent amidase/aminoacylase/carboxypeptidase family protein
MTKLMADNPGQWNGSLLALFRPAEETGDGAQGMVDDGLLTRIPAPDVALAQHVLPGVAGTAARAAIAAWIEDYNHVRRHSALGMVSPVDYERALAGKDAA